METKSLNLQKNCIVCLSERKFLQHQYISLQNCSYEQQDIYSLLCGTAPSESRLCPSCSQKLQEISNFRSQCKNSRELFLKYTDQIDSIDDKSLITKEEPACLFVETTLAQDIPEVIESGQVKEKSPTKKRGRKPRPRKIRIDRSGVPCREEVLQKLQCSLCDYVGPTVNQFTKHIRKAHPYQSLACPLCSTHTRNPSALAIHFTVCPKRPEINVEPCYKCPACGELVVRLHNHIETCHAQMLLYECHHCRNRFMQRSAVWSHLISVHSTQSYNCDICGKTYKSVYHLNHHQKLTHGVGAPMRKCKFCDYQTFNRVSLRTHQLLHNTEETFVCDVCCKSFRTKAQLTRHQLCHSEGKQFVCSECGLAFKVKRYLQTHKRVHSPPGKV